jgi:hypothetical protein
MKSGVKITLWTTAIIICVALIAIRGFFAYFFDFDSGDSPAERGAREKRTETEYESRMSLLRNNSPDLHLEGSTRESVFGAFGYNPFWGEGETSYWFISTYYLADEPFDYAFAKKIDDTLVSDGWTRTERGLRDFTDNSNPKIIDYYKQVNGEKICFDVMAKTNPDTYSDSEVSIIDQIFMGKKKEFTYNFWTSINMNESCR